MRPIDSPLKSPTAKTRLEASLQLLALALGAVMAILDITAINVALSSMDDELKMGVDGLIWIADSYTLAYAALLFLGATLSRRYGARSVYRGGLLVFIAASILCFLAPNGMTLIASRFLQGAGAAIFTPSALSLVATTYRNDEERNRAMSRWISIVSIAAVVGPLLSGLLIHLSSWRLIFLVNIPFGGLALWLTSRYVTPRPGNPGVVMNFSNHLILTICLAGICLLLIEGHQEGWVSIPILAYMLLVATTSTMLYLREKHSASPIFSPVLLATRGFTAALVAFTTLSITFYCQLFVVALIMQKSMGFSALDVGLKLIPAMAIIAPANLLSGRIASRTSVAASASIGLFIAVIGAGILMTIRPESPWWVVVLGMAVANLGNGLTAPALTIAVMQPATPSHTDMASGLLNFGRQIGALMGVACAGIAFGSADADWHLASKRCFVLVIAFHIVTFLFVLRLASTAVFRQ